MEIKGATESETDYEGYPALEGAMAVPGEKPEGYDEATKAAIKRGMEISLVMMARETQIRAELGLQTEFDVEDDDPENGL